MKEDLLNSARQFAEQGRPGTADERPGRSDDRGLLGSRHARLVDHIEAPKDDLTLEEAQILCGQVTRQWLGDFAPGLILVEANRRRRLQAVLTVTRTALDFALQPGVEGERVTALNRLQFEVESALDGSPRGQPAHMVLADEHGRLEWSRDAWDGLFELLRRVAFQGELTAERSLKLSQAIGVLSEPDAASTLSGTLATILAHAEASRIRGDNDLPGITIREHDRHWRRFAVYVKLANDCLGETRSGRSIRLRTRLWLLVRSHF